MLLAALVSFGSLMAAPVAKAEFPFESYQRVSTMGQDGDPMLSATNADVAYDSTHDRYMAVWQGTQSTTEGPEIYGQLMSRSNVQIGAAFKISQTPGQFASEEPTITYNPTSDEFLVLWAAKHSADGAKEIYGQRLNQSGDELGGSEDFLVSTTGPGTAAFDASAPDLAYNSTSGNYLAVWRSNDQAAGEYEIYGQTLSGTGTAVGADDFRVSTTGPDGNPSFGAFDPAVAVDPVGGRFLVAWSSDDSLDGEREIYTRPFDGDGSPIAGQAQTRISHMGPDGNKNFDALEPSLAFNPSTGEYLIAWRGDATGQDDQFEVYAQRVNADNVEVGAPDFRVSDMGPDGSTAYAVGERPTVEYLSVPNHYLVLWHGDDNTPPLVDDEFEIFGQALAADGQAVGVNDFRVTNYGAGSPGADAELPMAAYNPQANQELVVWQGIGGPRLAATESEIFSRRVGDDRDGDGKIDGFDDQCSTVPGGPIDANGDGCPDDRDNDGLLDVVDRCPGAPAGAFDANRDGCPDDTDGDGVLDERDVCRTTPGGRLDTNHNGCPGPFGTVDGARLSSSVDDFGSYVKVNLLRFRDLPKARVRIRLSCIRRCKVKETRIKRAGRSTVDSRRFKGKRLRSGAVITARITAKDLIGSLRRYEVRGKDLDLREIRKARACIPIASDRPRKRCDRGR